MDAYKTEDEQLEALKRWMRDNGRNTFIAVLAVVLVAFGAYTWKQRQAQQQAGASAQYQGLVDAARQLDRGASKEMLATARHLADTLKKDYGQTTYAQFAALYKARLAVQDNDLAQAETELRWVLEHEPAADLAALTQLRLARVLYAKGDADGALKLLDDKSAGGHTFAYAQLRGDIKLARGDADGARAEYQRAQELERNLKDPLTDPLLDIKLRDLQTGAAPAAAAAPAPAPAAN